MFKLSYRKVEYHGREKIPKDGAIIFAPNHSNTLIDPLAVLPIDKQAKVFVARADIFKQPTILKILTFLKMLPINRMRDGMDSLAKNEEINDTVVKVLHDKVPFCILPEGTHRTKHSLMPLQKGIFRIALQANDTFGNEMPVYIVPVGIEFGHFFRFRSSLLVQIGEPINVTQFVNEHPEWTAPKQINELKEELSDRMKDVILQITDDENYNATLELVQLNNKSEPSLINRFKASKETIKKVEDLLQSNPQETQQLLNHADEFSRQRHNAGIGMESILSSNIQWSLISKLSLLLLGLPYFIFSAVVTSPVTLLSIWIGSKFKDKAFLNSLRLVVALVLLPILLLLLVPIVTAVFSWEWGIVFALLFIPSFFFLHSYLRLVRRFISDIKWLIHRNLLKQFKDIKKRYNYWILHSIIIKYKLEI